MIAQPTLEASRPNASAPVAIPHVAVAIPCGTMVHADFAVSLGSMMHTLGEMPMSIVVGKSSIVADARNLGLEFAQKQNADYILFIDSDMTFPRDALLKLLVRNVDIIGATYSRRTAPFNFLGDILPEQPADAPKGLLEMARIPTGFLLVKSTVFERLKRPYFRFRVDEEAGVNIGEDYDFSDRVRSLGFRIWCDPYLSKELGHIGEQAFKL
ncbi:glycosyltransferase [Methylobacterium sp. A49B]|nr:glycosyltransferase [Methylobacterium mesophilicum]